MAGLRRRFERAASLRTKEAKERTADAETSPLRTPGAYQYDFNIAEITEVWRRGSVIASWLLI
jgi:6-phosphogluconate dehydrogenase (decarboxylating)